MSAPPPIAPPSVAASPPTSQEAPTETLPCAGTGLDPAQAPTREPTKDGGLAEVPSRASSKSSRRTEREAPSGLPDTFGIVDTILDGRYHVERVVGHGGFGVVYRARHLAFDAPVAIKVLRVPDGLNPSKREEFVRSFLSEGRVLFELESLHPAIIRAFETGSLAMPAGGVAPYLALEWLDGLSLERELQSRQEAGAGCYSLKEAMSLLARAVEGIALAHDRGIAHRDIKPGNIFLTVSDGVPYAKVLDFGLAKVMADTSSVTQMLADTTGGQTPFTPAYGAPEQWLRRLGATGPWTDVYALALVFVELMSGRRALAGGDAHQLMAACLDAGCRPTPRAAGVRVSDAVEGVMARALAVDPRDRYRSASAFWQALCEAAEWSPLRSDPCPVFGVTGALRHQVRVAGSDSSTQSGARSRSGVPADSNLSSMQPVSGNAGVVRGGLWPWAAAGAAVAIAVLSAIVLLRPRTAPQQGQVMITATSASVAVEAGEAISSAGSPAQSSAEVPAPSLPEPSQPAIQPVAVPRPKAAGRATASSALATASEPAASPVQVPTAAVPTASATPPHPPSVPGPKELLTDDELSHRK